MGIESQIKTLAVEHKAVILAHNYQVPEIQDIADHTGDSLELSRIAAEKVKEEGYGVIVFCGVHFMAESAAILSPESTVLLPDMTAGCPMAEMASPGAVMEMKRRHPRAKVVTYINSTAAVKAVSDVICTSSNAQRIVERIDADEIIFVPDRNLGSYVQRFTTKRIILWDGFCPTHDSFTKEDLDAVKKDHPDSLVMVHPECRPEVVDGADEVLSTGQMVSFVQNTGARSIIVGTDQGMIHRLKKAAPEIDFIPASGSFFCPDMKKIDQYALLESLRQGRHRISIPPEIRDKSRRALDLMLELSR
ncbi:MAG: quinolinate synthase NadA [Spirochaetes bacterium]|nr:quinolinate synthase NadA [Spirochaetota bacterium]